MINKPISERAYMASMEKSRKRALVKLQARNDEAKRMAELRRQRHLAAEQSRMSEAK